RGLRRRGGGGGAAREAAGVPRRRRRGVQGQVRVRCQRARLRRVRELQDRRARPRALRRLPQGDRRLLRERGRRRDRGRDAAPQPVLADPALRVDLDVQRDEPRARAQLAVSPHEPRAREGLHRVGSPRSHAGVPRRLHDVGARGQAQVPRGHHGRSGERADGLHRPPARQELRQDARARRRGQEPAMSHEDRYGLPLTTESRRAVDAYVEGVDRLLSVQPGADRCFRLAIDADPGFALAHIALARTQQLRLEAAEARATAARARALVRDHTPREKGHVETIARAIEGDATGALDAVRAHCGTHRRDALVLQLNFGAFGLISFAGRREHDEEMWEFFKPYAGDYGVDWWFRFAWAWAHTESGRIAEGRRLMEQAFTLNPRN